MSNNFEKDYINLIDHITQKGTFKKDRTSVGSNQFTFGSSLFFDTENYEDGFISAPFMQSRIFGPRIAFEELMWMINGRVDVKWLQDRNIHIWDGNTTKEYLASIGKSHIKEGTIGKGYGYQFRNFNGVDQLKQVFEGLRDNPNGRRHLISLWNPADFNDMALEPCHFAYCFNVDVENNELNLNQIMRSSDVILGKPYNMAFTSFFCALFAKALGYKVGKLWFTAVDNHIYDNLHDIADEMVNSKNINTIPKFKIKKEINTFEDILSVEWKDIEIKDFVRGPSIGKPKMAV